MNKKNVLTAGLTVAATGILAVAMRPAAVPVDTATVGRGTLQVTVDERGRTRARYRYTVASPVTGRVLRTPLDEGDRVEKGALLVNIAPPPENSRIALTAQAELAGAGARKKEAEALLVEAQSNRQRAASEAERRDDLYRRGLVSIEERNRYAQAAESASARVASAEATLLAASAGVESARARLLGIDSAGSKDGIVGVAAPVSGRVLRVLEESERVVPAGTPLFELSRGDELELIIDLLTEDAVKVHAGDEIRISGWGGEPLLSGKVRYIEPGAFTKISTLGVEEQRVNVIGDLDDAPPELGAGFRIEAAIVTWEGEDVLLVPTSALFRRGNAWQTFVVEDDRARLRGLDVGRRSVEYAQVTGGVVAGDRVILFPSDLIEDGVRVTHE